LQGQCDPNASFEFCACGPAWRSESRACCGKKLGFVLHRRDLLYAVGVDIPKPAARFSNQRPETD
jgi:hypothetical protein